jgi:hypothetical protein
MPSVIWKRDTLKEKSSSLCKAVVVPTPASMRRVEIG